MLKNEKLETQFYIGRNRIEYLNNPILPEFDFSCFPVLDVQLKIYTK